MARQEKTTRLRGLNPYLQKQKAQSAIFYVTSAFNDKVTTTDFFVSCSSVNYPTTFMTTSQYLTAELTTSLNAPGRQVPSNCNQYIQISDSQIPLISPYSDHSKYENDDYSLAASASFYRTGSAIEVTGFGFQQSLRDKTKIVIDMPFNGTSHLSSAQQNDCPMGYYNFSSSKIQGIGLAAGPADIVASTATLTEYLDGKAIGFSPCISNPFDPKNNYSSKLALKTQGLPMREFGFPSDERYNVSNDSGYVFPLSTSISEPFLLEKMILEIGSLSLLIDSTAVTLTDNSSAVINFFVLNKRENNLFKDSYTVRATEEFTYANYPATATAVTVSLASYSTTKSTKLDLVSFARICTVRDTATAGDFLFPYVDLPVENDGAPNLSFSLTNKKINLNVNQATKNTEIFSRMQLLSKTRVYSTEIHGLNGTRSGVDQISDRNWLKGVASDQIGVIETITNLSTSYATTIKYNENSEDTIPYLLLPTDKLIIGWQAPVFDFYHLINDAAFIANSSNFWASNTQDAISVTFSGNYKLVLYGSYLKSNEDLDYVEYHKYDMNDQTLNTISTVNIGGNMYKGEN
jgi:hypothetical protein